MVIWLLLLLFSFYLHGQSVHYEWGFSTKQKHSLCIESAILSDKQRPAQGNRISTNQEVFFTVKFDISSEYFRFCALIYLSGSSQLFTKYGKVVK